MKQLYLYINLPMLSYYNHLLIILLLFLRTALIVLISQSYRTILAIPNICRFQLNTIVHIIVIVIIYDTGAQNPSLLLPRYKARGPSRIESFSNLQFFNSAGVREFAISCKPVIRF